MSISGFDFSTLVLLTLLIVLDGACENSSALEILINLDGGISSSSLEVILIFDETFAAIAGSSS